MNDAEMHNTYYDTARGLVYTLRCSVDYTTVHSFGKIVSVPGSHYRGLTITDSVGVDIAEYNLTRMDDNDFVQIHHMLSDIGSGKSQLTFEDVLTYFNL